MSFLGHTTGDTGGGVGQFTITKPIECVPNGWLFAIMNSNCLDASGHDIAPMAAGWTLVGHLQAGTAGASVSHMHVFKRKVVAGEGGASAPTTFDFDVVGTARSASWACLAYDYLDQDDPIVVRDFSNDGGLSDDTIFCPVVAGGTNGDPLIRAVTNRSASGFTTFGAYTGRVNFSPALGFAIGWQESVVSGGVAAISISSVAVAQHVGMTMILKPGEMVGASTLKPDGVASASGYSDANTGNITRIHGDPDVPGGTGFTAS